MLLLDLRYIKRSNLYHEVNAKAEKQESINVELMNKIKEYKEQTLKLKNQVNSEIKLNK